VAGFPIEYDRARQTYVFGEGYTLRRPNLTVEEMLAFALAKHLLGSFGPGATGVCDGVDNAAERCRKSGSVLLRLQQGLCSGAEAVCCRRGSLVDSFLFPGQEKLVEG
jgi:hypothetical protein